MLVERQIFHYTSKDNAPVDIIKEYIDAFENYLVGSIEKIPLQDCSVDCVICVGSVINYVDIQKAIAEFSRILKPNGIVEVQISRHTATSNVSDHYIDRFA